MPRIPSEYLNCVVYLYPSEDAAKEGVALGGSGFLVGIRQGTEPTERLYAITNSHVIKEAACKVLRFNTRNSEPRTHAIANWEWTHHPDGDDIAVASFPILEDHERSFVPGRDVHHPAIHARVRDFSGDGDIHDGSFDPPRWKTEKQSQRPFWTLGHAASIGTPSSGSQAGELRCRDDVDRRLQWISGFYLRASNDPAWRHEHALSWIKTTRD